MKTNIEETEGDRKKAVGSDIRRTSNMCVRMLLKVLSGGLR